jgi:peptidyl-prolyl cis-trans isomerase D
MSIIQTIRERGALISVIIIALSLLGFIAMDAFSGRSNLFGGGQSTTVGSVNGKKISYDDFQKVLAAQEQSMQQQGYPSGDQLRQRALENAWNQQVYKTLIESELTKLGIAISQKELNNSILSGPNASEEFKRQFTDPQTGQFDPVAAIAQIRNLLKTGTPDQKAYLHNMIEELEFARRVEKYSSLLINSSNAPKWMLEKQNIDNSQMATVSLVRKPYSDIPDTTIKIADQEIADYISKHKKDFKQEESRSIAFVTFSAAPSSADSATVRGKLDTLKTEMKATADIKAFLEKNAVQTFYDSYISGNTIQVPAKDSIFRTPVGEVYGPYIDGGSYSIAKVIGVRQIPDSVKVRHILISTTQRDQQTGQTTTVRDDASAKAIADSVQRVIAAGQNFDSVCAKVSEDPGSKDKGGVYETGSGQMVPEFNDFMFTMPAGSKAVVKTDFGYHYMEIVSQKGSATGYKIAYISEPVVTSEETERMASNDASQFAGQSRDEKAFSANFEKNLKPKGHVKGFGPNILPNAFEVTGLAPSRALVKKIYDADLGEVLQPEKVGSDYVVAVVTEINKEGTQSVGKARNMVEPLLRNHKKAELIKKQIGNITTLEAAATALGKTIETADSVRMSGSQSPVIGNESKIVGAAFNPANRGKVVNEAIEGAQGVYVVRVDNVSATALADANVAEQRKNYYLQMKQQAQYSNPFQALHDAANVKDNRSKFY